MSKKKIQDDFLEAIRSVQAITPDAATLAEERGVRAGKRKAELELRRKNPARSEVLKRAKQQVWTADTNPTGPEPIVPAKGLYGLDDDSLSVCEYGSLCLTSTQLFIADIDGNLDGGELLGKYPQLSPIDCIFHGLSVLDELAGSDFMHQFYRVYTTRAGYRVICTSKPIPVSAVSLSLLRFLYADPRYAVMCEQDNNYRARLTPKPYRVLKDIQEPFTTEDMQSVYDVIDDWYVCERVGWFLNGEGWYFSDGEEVVHPDLIEPLRVHDDLCLAVKENAKQA